MGGGSSPHSASASRCEGTRALSQVHSEGGEHDAVPGGQAPSPLVDPQWAENRNAHVSDCPPIWQGCQWPCYRVDTADAAD